MIITSFNGSLSSPFYFPEISSGYLISRSVIVTDTHQFHVKNRAAVGSLPLSRIHRSFFPFESPSLNLSPSHTNSNEVIDVNLNRIKKRKQKEKMKEKKLAHGDTIFGGTKS